MLIMGATDTMLEIMGVTTGNNGAYTCVATNLVGAVESAAETVTILGEEKTCYIFFLLPSSF